MGKASQIRFPPFFGGSCRSGDRGTGCRDVADRPDTRAAGLPVPQLPAPIDDGTLLPEERLSSEAYSVAVAAKKVSPSVVKISTKQEELVFSFFFRPIIQEREGLDPASS